MTLRKLFLCIFGLAVLTSTVLLLGIEEVLVPMRQVNPGIFALLILMQVLTLLVPAMQWQYLLKKMKQKLSPGLVLAVILAGNYVESVTPAAKLGGEAVKVYLFHKHSNLDYDRLSGILLALKYFSMLPFVGLASIFAGFAFISFELPRLALSAFVFLFLIFTALLLVYYKAGKEPDPDFVQIFPFSLSSASSQKHIPRIIGRRLLVVKGKLLKVKAFVVRAARHSRKMTNRFESVVLVGTATLVWFAYPVKTYLVAWMLGLEITLMQMAVVTFTAYLVSMVPLMPGGLGSFEATMALMFALIGYSPAEGLAVALITRLITYWFPLLLSAVAAAYLAMLRVHHVKSMAGKRICQGGRVGSET